MIGRETINISEIFSSVHGFMGKTVITAGPKIRLDVLTFDGVKLLQSANFLSVMTPSTPTHSLLVLSPVFAHMKRTRWQQLKPNH